MSNRVTKKVVTFEGVRLMRCSLADETAACSSSRCMKRASSKLGTVREPLARSRA